MKIIECAGAPREIGRQTGEAQREEIREFLARWRPWKRGGFPERLPVFLEVMKANLPGVLEEMGGMAEGAGLPVEDIYALNLPDYPNDLRLEQGCTNIAFADGPDGPLWGKNNDGGPPGEQLPVCARVIRPDHGIPVVEFPFCGMVGVGDGMNAEGVAVGHSSVGSVLQRSDRHVPIRPWSHHVLQQCRTVGEWVEMMASRPLRGKGYSYVCVDHAGSACSVEAPCPALQVRPRDHAWGTLCVNCYLLPAMAGLTARAPDDALARKALIEREMAQDAPRDVERMKRLLRSHGDPVGLCRHGAGELGRIHTEYSMIGVTRDNLALVAHGHPCEETYREIRL